MSTGEVAWVREDGLGSAVAMEMVDLPPADQSGSIASFITSTTNEGNPLKLALMRLRLQASLLKVRQKNFLKFSFLNVDTMTPSRSSLKIFKTGAYPISLSLKTNSYATNSTSGNSSSLLQQPEKYVD